MSATTPKPPPAGRTRRGPALIVLAALIAAGALIDRQVERTTPDEETAVSAQVPVAAPASARSSAWYCPGVPTSGESGEGSVVVANAGSRRLTGTVTAFPDRGQSATAPVTVEPAGRATVRLADLVSARYASAVVELDGGEAVAESVADGALGQSVAPCASSASSTWHFAEGATTRDASEVLLALNPFPDDAVVDLVFSTEEGIVTPQALTGLLVRAQALTSINVGDFVQRRESVSATLTARTGRLVVGRVQTFDGTVGRKGISVALGAAATGGSWYFPEGLVTDGQDERFHLYNPGAEEAQVELALTLDEGEAEPLRLTVPRESRLTVVAGEESRIPKGVAHSVTVRSVGGPEVVVERAIHGTSPSSRTGLAVTLGARMPATRWATAAGAADDRHNLWVVVQNPGERAASVTLSVLAGGTPAPIGAFERVEVPAGQRRALHVNPSLTQAAVPLFLVSTEPVVVERDIYRVRSPGMAMSAAIPLR